MTPQGPSETLVDLMGRASTLLSLGPVNRRRLELAVSQDARRACLALDALLAGGYAAERPDGIVKVRPFARNGTGGHDDPHDVLAIARLVVSAARRDYHGGEVVPEVVMRALRDTLGQ